MKIIEPSVELVKFLTTKQVMNHLNRFGRFSYLSEPKDTTNDDFIKTRIREGHESVIEHVSLSAVIICDRGVLAEITRHRLASYTVESTRYCNYSKDKFGNELTFIKPCYLEENTDPTSKYNLWKQSMQDAENTYISMINSGCKPEEARAVLPNSLKTTIGMTANLREWRHFFKLRTDIHAHPQMRQVANMLLDEMYEYLPAIFEDIVEIRNHQ